MISSEKNPLKNQSILLTIIIILLVIQTSISAYNLYRDHKWGVISATNRAALTEEFQSSAKTIYEENRIAIEDFLNDYKRDVHNPEIKTAQEQQLAAFDYIIHGFLFLARQNNQLLLLLSQMPNWQ